MKEYEKAIEMYDLILKIDPNRNITIHNKGCAYKNLGKYD